MVTSPSTLIDPRDPILAPAQIFEFNEEISTQYVHLNITSNHGNEDFAGFAEIAFEEVPFEFSKFPAMVFLVAVGGLGYFRNKKRGDKV